MVQNKKGQLQRVDYVTPAVAALDILSEGLLCVSSPGSTIDSATEDDWGTLI